jgi:phospholipid/cholesterol/gamma-HCH transport system substrate-binding protein
MAYRADEVKVGLVVVVSLVILAGFVIAILGLNVGQSMETYSTELKFAGGIERGTIVRFGGMQVGKVTGVEVSPADDTMIRLMLSVNNAVPIKTDSEIFINTIGFLGDYYLEISTGSPGSPELPPGSEIKSMEVASINEMLTTVQSAIEKVDATMIILNEKILAEDFEKFKDRIEAITDKIIQLLSDVDLVFNEENRENIAMTLLQIKELVQENKDDARATVENFRSASEKLESLAATLDKVAGENSEDIGPLIDEITATVSEIRSAAEGIDRIISDNATDIDITIDNLRATSANTRDFSETIADDPWRIFWRTRQPERKTFDARETESIER